MAIKVSAINNMTSAKDSAILAFASDFLKSEGVVNIDGNDLKVTEQSPNAMAIDVEKGYVYVQNDAWAQGSNQPKFYRVEIDTKTGKSLTPNASANNWIVAICIKVDVGTSTPGASGELAGTIEAVYGTPAASPVAPAIPNHHYPIAYVTYNSSHTVITNARITDQRAQARLKNDSYDEPTLDNLKAFKAEDSGGTARNLMKVDANNNLVIGDLNLTKILPFSGLPLPSGQLLNGQILPSVSSNNLTLAIKTLAGTDPSATDPVFVRIKNNIRVITSALSVTRNAGTNWFNVGRAELATREVDYFAYLAWDSANSTVRLGFARIPYATVYSQFSATTTSDRYGAFNTNPGATDDVEVIGRFAATLSASASYNWSVPTYTSSNLIQRPIFETRVLLWVPTYSAGGSMTYTGGGVSNAQNYQIINNRCLCNISVTATIGGTPSNELRATNPIDGLTSGINANSYGGICFLGQGSYLMGNQYLQAAGVIGAGLYNYANMTAGVNGYWFGNNTYWLAA